MEIGQAIEAMENGSRLYRSGWNGKDMWLHLQQGYPVDKHLLPIQTTLGPSGKDVTPMEQKPYGQLLSHIMLKTNGESKYWGAGTMDFIPWHPAQQDLLESDWEIFRPELEIDQAAVRQTFPGNRIGHAITEMKKGNRVSRQGWNGKNMYLYYVPADRYPARTEAAREEFGEIVPYRAYIAMKTAQNDVVPWVASQSDVLAYDWGVVE